MYTPCDQHVCRPCIITWTATYLVPFVHLNETRLGECQREKGLQHWALPDYYQVVVTVT